ncbi:unnamed protein product, partial [Amoebophrya sp. A25]
SVCALDRLALHVRDCPSSHAIALHAVVGMQAWPERNVNEEGSTADDQSELFCHRRSLAHLRYEVNICGTGTDVGELVKLFEDEHDSDFAEPKRVPLVKIHPPRNEKAKSSKTDREVSESDEPRFSPNFHLSFSSLRVAQAVRHVRNLL